MVSLWKASTQCLVGPILHVVVQACMYGAEASIATSLCLFACKIPPTPPLDHLPAAAATFHSQHTPHAPPVADSLTVPSPCHLPCHSVPLTISTIPGLYLLTPVPALPVHALSPSPPFPLPLLLPLSSLPFTPLPLAITPFPPHAPSPSSHPLFPLPSTPCSPYPFYHATLRSTWHSCPVTRCPLSSSCLHSCRRHRPGGPAPSHSLPHSAYSPFPLSPFPAQYLASVSNDTLSPPLHPLFHPCPLPLTPPRSTWHSCPVTRCLLSSSCRWQWTSAWRPCWVTASMVLRSC